jgi:hypothetical protein
VANRIADAEEEEEKRNARSRMRVNLVGPNKSLFPSEDTEDGLTIFARQEDMDAQ